MSTSIVIPVFNSEKYLDRCLSSVVNQDCKDFEVIIINDGSTDKSEKIIKKYSAKYSYIKYYKQENSGVSMARNLGIKKCTKDYITFLDADDWLDNDYIQKSETYLKSQPVDLLLLPYIREYKQFSRKNLLFKDNFKKFSTKAEVDNNLLLKIFGPIGDELKQPASIDDLSPCWGKFYKSDICKNIYFEDISKIGAEDIWFNLNYIFHINSAAYISNTFYHYNKENTSSLTHKKGSEVFNKREKLYEAMELFARRYSLSRKYNLAIKNRVVVDLIGISNNIYSSNLSFIEKYTIEKKILNKKIYEIAFGNFDFHGLSGRWKLFFHLCKSKQCFVLRCFIYLGENLKPLLK